MNMTPNHGDSTTVADMKYAVLNNISSGYSRDAYSSLLEWWTKGSGLYRLDYD